MVRYSGWDKILARGDAALFIQGIESLRPGDKVVLCCRKSVIDTNDSLPAQEKRLRRVAAEHGLRVVSAYSVEESGRDGWWILPAVAAAKRLGAVALLAECVNRFARHQWFNPTVRWTGQLQATTRQLENLAYWADGIRLVTHLSPDATANEERSYQTERRPKHKRGGRPGKPGYKVRIREKRKPIAIRKRRLGWSIRKIAEFLNRSSSTVERWVKGVEKEVSRFSSDAVQSAADSPGELLENPRKLSTVPSR